MLVDDPKQPWFLLAGARIVWRGVVRGRRCVVTSVERHCAASFGVRIVEIVRVPVDCEKGQGLAGDTAAVSVAS